MNLRDPGADPGFQVRGGGVLKKIALSGGRREHFGGFSNFRGGGVRRVHPPSPRPLDPPLGSAT